MSATLEQSHTERRPHALRSGPVVLATHGSDGTDASLTAAWRLAQRLHEPLEVVTVLEPLPVYGAGDVALPMFMDEMQRAARETDVRRAIAAIGLRNDQWSLRTQYGAVGRGIASVAEEHHASLIVLAAHPHHRPWSTVAGERAAQVLRLADCPVLSVAPQWNGTVHQAVVAVDFGPPSLRAARLALDLIEPGGVLTLIHVRPLVDQQSVDLLSAASDRLMAMLRPDAPDGVTIQSRVARGSVVERVLECAQNTSADLIAVGTHGPTVLERLFVGSSAAGVLHGSTCTVLASPPPPLAEAISLGRAMGSVSSKDRATWAALLDGVTARNAGRRVTVEIDDPSFGAQVQGVGLAFRGAAYDHHDKRIDLMLDDGAPDRGHLTRTITAVESVGIASQPGGRDDAIQVRSGLGSTLLRFMP